MPDTLSTWRAISSPVLPFTCVAKPLPFTSLSVLMPASAFTTTWKYCG